MTRNVLSLGAALAAVLLLATSSQGDDPPKDARKAQAKPLPVRAVASDRPEDEKAVRAASQAFAEAFIKGDAKAVGALFTKEAEYIDEANEPIRGREALAKAYEGFFAKRKDVNAKSTTDAVRFLSENSAVEQGTFTVSPKGEPENSSRYSALYVRENGRWLIAMMKEWSDETTSQPSLDEISWLIGSWVNESDEMSARTTYEWTANKAFIRMQYTLTPKKGDTKTSSGVQVIGVDPAVGRIRAWLFASDGGIGESTWGWDEDHWRIETVGTLADGSETTAVNFLTPSGEDAFKWRSVGRTLNGEAQRDIPQVTVKRVAGEEKTKKAARRVEQRRKEAVR